MDRRRRESLCSTAAALQTGRPLDSTHTAHGLIVKYRMTRPSCAVCWCIVKAGTLDQLIYERSSRHHSNLNIRHLTCDSWRQLPCLFSENRRGHCTNAPFSGNVFMLRCKRSGGSEKVERLVVNQMVKLGSRERLYSLDWFLTLAATWT